MSKRIRYEASAPGQAPKVKIDGELYERGMVYRKSDARSKHLVKIVGGFEYVNDLKRSAVADAEGGNNADC